MYESQERYRKVWESSGDDAVTPAGFISARNLAGIIGCSDATVRVQLQKAGIVGTMVKRVTVEGKKLIGQMLVYPKEEALDVMYAWEEGREAMYVKKVARIDEAARRREERAAARRAKEAEERRRIAEERAVVRAERKRMMKARTAELAREKARRKQEREKAKEERRRAKVRARRAAARERVRAGGGRAK